MNTLKKALLSLAVIITTITSYAQTTTIYGKVTKGDGSRIKGTSVMRGYEDQLIIVNYTGGSDHTASIEIEVPTSACIADFRNLITTTPQQPIAVKSITNTAIKSSVIPTVSAGQIAVSPGKITPQSLQTFPISRIDISVTNRVSNNLPTIARQVILEDVKAEGCTDLATSNTTKIKLKANRIGWIYYNMDTKGNISVSSKSGWDTVKGTAWTNF